VGLFALSLSSGAMEGIAAKGMGRSSLKSTCRKTRVFLIFPSTSRWEVQIGLEL